MAHVRGCKYAIYNYLEYKYKMTAGIFIGILIPQLIGVVLIIIYILILNYLVDMDLADLHLKYIRRLGLKKNEIFIYSHSMPNVFTMSHSVNEKQPSNHKSSISFNVNQEPIKIVDSKVSSSTNNNEKSGSKIYFHLQ